MPLVLRLKRNFADQLADSPLHRGIVESGAGKQFLVRWCVCLRQAFDSLA